MSDKKPVNIPLFKVHMPTEADAAVLDILHSGALASGPNVAQFRELLSEYIGNPNVVPTMEVSSSIELALQMAGVKPGDEVIASPAACLATNEPILMSGAKPVFCDIDPKSISPIPKDVRSRITERTKALLLYHWAGNPVDIDPLLQLAREHNIKVIDDAGEAIGTKYRGKILGNCGVDYTVFSFYPNRHITTIEGGAIAFAEQSEWERGRWLQRYGMYMPTFRGADGELNPESDIPEAGPNSYLNNVHAAIGVKQMKYLPGIVQKHAANGRFYDDVLKSVPGAELLMRQRGSEPSHWVYTFLAQDRDSLLRKLKERGIGTSILHLRNDHYSCFAPQLLDLPGVAYFQQRVINIPCGWWLSEEDLQYVADTIKEGW